MHIIVSTSVWFNRLHKLILVYNLKKITKLHKSIHHGSINLVKERQLFKQIKQTREAEKMRADSPVKIRCWHIMCDVTLEPKEALKDHIEGIRSKTRKSRYFKPSTYSIFSSNFNYYHKLNLLKKARASEKQKKIKKEYHIII